MSVREKEYGFLRANALTLAFGFVFLATLVGQALSGVADFNAQQVANGLEQISLLDYLTSSSFGVDVMENWQSEYLQFFLYILATVWLVQRGSSESKKPGEEGPESDKEQKIGRHADEDSPAWARTGGLRTAVFARSLGLLMGVLFLLTRLLRLRGAALDQPDGGEDVEEELEVLRLPVLHDVDPERGRRDVLQQRDLLQPVRHLLGVEVGDPGEGLADQRGQEDEAERQGQGVGTQEAVLLLADGHRPISPRALT